MPDPESENAEAIDVRVHAALQPRTEFLNRTRSRARESASPPGVSDIATTALAAGAERGAAVWAGDRDAVAAAATGERSAITDYPFWDDREAAGWYVGLQQ
jgi:hypothetical protein